MGQFSGGKGLISGPRQLNSAGTPGVYRPPTTVTPSARLYPSTTAPGK